MSKGFSISIFANSVTVDVTMDKTYDNIHIELPDFEFVLEGVVLNRKKMLQEYALSDFQTLILELYRTKKELIVKEFEGEFRGFIYDKKLHKLFVFTNPTSTQSVFYFREKEQIFVDSGLVRLNRNLRNSGVKQHPDIHSFYQLLCFGNLPENKTVIQNTYKILDGHFLEIDTEKLSIQEKKYFEVSENQYFNGTKEKAIQQLHDLFSESVKMEYSKDVELGKNHLALLSGGLDSRVAVFYAMKINEKPDSVLCFSHEGYFDETISRKIAEDYHLHYEFIPLNGGVFLKKIDELTEISEGRGLFTGGVHVQHALDRLQYQNFSLFHSGQIGDGILGGFNSEPERKKPTLFKIVNNPDFLPKVENSLAAIAERYETEELFLLRNLAYNRTVLGAQVLQQKAYQTSPFMSKEFLKFSLSLPESWKYKHGLYIEWVTKYCKEATNYTWERTLMKPNAHWKTVFGDKVLKRGFVFFNNKILKTPQNASMYPYQYYFDESEDIQKFYQNYFSENIFRLEQYPEFSDDVKMLFQSPKFYHKSQAVNVLSIFKLFFDS